MSTDNIFWRDEQFPYLEIRKTVNSTDCYKTHSHVDFLSVGAVTEGCTVMLCQERRLEVGRGSLVFFNPSEPHSCNPVSGGARSYWMMHLDRGWCAEIQRGIFETGGEYIPLSTDITDDMVLFEDFIHICGSFVSYDEYFDGGPELAEFASDIFFRFCRADAREPVPAVLLEEVSEYIRENYQKSFSLEELAKKFRQNRFHLLRSFKEAFGVPPVSFQMNLRVEAAKKLLRDGRSIADTAQITGFSDQSHFHRVFRKHTAATPGQYSRGR